MRLIYLPLIIFVLLPFICPLWDDARGAAPEGEDNASESTPGKPNPPETPQGAPISIGQWVSYEIKRYARDSDESRPRDLSTSDLKISVVDKETIDEVEYFWVEFLINEGQEQQRVVRFMIDNEGVPQPIKLITKYGKLRAVEIELKRWEVKTRLTAGMIFNEMTRGLNIIPFTRLTPSDEESEEEDISVSLAGAETRFKCQKISFVDRASRTSASIWYEIVPEPELLPKRIPLAGLVKFFFVEPLYRTIFLLKDYGVSGGRTVITEIPGKLDFRETK